MQSLSQDPETTPGWFEQRRAVFIIRFVRLYVGLSKTLQFGVLSDKNIYRWTSKNYSTYFFFVLNFLNNILDAYLLFSKAKS